MDTWRRSRRGTAAGITIITVLVVTSCTPEVEPSVSPTPPVESPSASALAPVGVVPPLGEGQVVAVVPLAGTFDAPPSDGYRLAGRPDGLGLAMIDGAPTLLVTHEFPRGWGVARAHGHEGAFVSAWSLDPEYPGAAEGRDLITGVSYWDYDAATWSRTPTLPAGSPEVDLAQWSKLCSAYLSEPGRLWDEQTQTGYDGQLFFINEEEATIGRGFAVTLAGGAYQLPALGLYGRENTAIAAGTGPATVAVITEDSTAGQLWIYTGEKRATGNVVEQAGLSGGELTVLTTVAGGAQSESSLRASYAKGDPIAVTISAPIDTTATGAVQNGLATERGITFSRPEDIAFDPADPNIAYFTTTSGGGSSADPSLPGSVRDGGGLWKLEFEDAAHPGLGATLTLLLDGTEAPYLDGPDNIAVDGQGNILIQEDPTSGSHYRRILAYRIADGALAVVTHVPLVPGEPVSASGGSTIGAGYESSGIVDASDLYGPGWFLFDVQVHNSDGLADAIGVDGAARAMEPGYLYALYVGDWGLIFGG